MSNKSMVRSFTPVAGMVLLAACGGSAAQDQAPSTATINEAASSETQIGWGGQWEVRKDASTLSFTGKQNGKAFTGTFRDFDADIHFDPDNLNEAAITVTVTMKSAKIGDRQKDSALPGNDWFAVKDYPQAVFRSEAITASADGGYLAEGTLTMRDASKELALPFTVDIDGDSAQARGSVTIIRTDFGVGQGEWQSGQWVALEVDIDFEISATR
ncbi:MAG: YceI family protein [Pseudomonadota bacterium]